MIIEAHIINDEDLKMNLTEPCCESLELYIKMFDHITFYNIDCSCNI